MSVVSPPFVLIILAPLEGWSITDGIYYIFSILLGLGTPLTEKVPTTLGGDFVDIIISSMALGTIAIVVDYVTVLNPARYIRKRIKEFLIQHGMPEIEEDRDPAPGQLPAAEDSRYFQRGADRGHSTSTLNVPPLVHPEEVDV